jgi:hypothetical protein
MDMGFMLLGKRIHTHTYTHTAEPLVPERGLIEVEIAIGKLKSYNSPGTTQIPAELIKADTQTYLFYME